MATTPESMLSFAPAAVEAWSAVVTALVAAIGLPFLLWDRFRRKPHGVSGYVVVNQHRPELSVYLFSDTGERLIITSLSGGAHFRLAKRDERSPAQQKADGPKRLLFLETLKMRVVVPRDHAGNSSLVRVNVRTVEAATWRAKLQQRLQRERIEVCGVLPYRSRRFKVALTRADGGLRKAVLRKETKRQPES